jgi:predicted nucleotidyltransferase
MSLAGGESDAYPRARDRMRSISKQVLDVPFDTAALIDICRRNDVTMIGLVGSMARGEATNSSDIDLIVRFAKPKSLIFAIEAQQVRRHAGIADIARTDINGINAWGRIHVSAHDDCHNGRIDGIVAINVGG